MNDWQLMVDKQDLAARFGKAAADYDRYALIQKEIGQHLLSRLPRSTQKYPVALDLGCGTGFFLKKLQPLCEQLVGLDLSSGMLATAQAGGASAWLVGGDAESLPFAEACCDLVYSSLALQWCASLPGALAELRRVLRPGGVLAFSTLLSGSLCEMRRAWQQLDSQDHVNPFISAALLANLCKDQGFTRLHWECRRHVVYYNTLSEVLTGLKGIGANQVSGQRVSGLGGRQRWLRLQAAYETERDASGYLPVSYEVCYGVLSR